MADLAYLSVIISKRRSGNTPAPAWMSDCLFNLFRLTSWGIAEMS